MFAHVNDPAGGIEHEPAKIEPHDRVCGDPCFQPLSREFGMRAGCNREMIGERAEQCPVTCGKIGFFAAQRDPDLSAVGFCNPHNAGKKDVGILDEWRSETTISKIIWAQEFFQGVHPV
ncbi:MAG: hypothetical protein GW822_15415 [Sphingomonadales bacterium]|nr:hypothetical protein [Sphingomonadales bacterium]